MKDATHSDIRKLLRTFGIGADEAINAHLARISDGPSLALRITLEDLTDYGDSSPDQPLKLVIESEIQR